jgi:hypothetical protein
VTPHGGLRLALPGTELRLDISEPWFEVEDARQTPEGPYVFASNAPTGEVVSAAVHAAPPSAGDCRDYYWQRVQRDELERRDVRFHEYDGLKLVAYTVPEAMGEPVDQRNVLACDELGGAFAFVHLSKTSFQPSEQILLDSTLSSVSFYRGAMDTAVAPRHFPVPAHGFLALELPVSWRSWMRLPSLDRPPTITIVPSEGSDWEILVTAFWDGLHGFAMSSPAVLQDALEDSRAQAGSKGVDAEAQIHPWKTAQGFGAYFASESRQPGPTEFRYMRHGWAKAGELALSFTISAHSPTAPIFEQGLEILRRAQQDTDPS